LNTERIVLVGTVWAVLLLALLVLREFVRAIRSRSQGRILPVLDRLVVVMIVAFALAAIVRVGSLIGPAAPSGSPGPSSSQIANASATPSPSTSGKPTSTPKTTPKPTPSSSPSASPTPKPTPSPTPVPTPSPSGPPTSPPTGTPTIAPTQEPTPTPTPAPQGGTVSLPKTFRAYEVQGGMVVGYHEIRVKQRIRPRCTGEKDYPFPTFSDPNGKVKLVKIVSGKFAGKYVSPDDDGVIYRPNG
jgi:outer membrane biosynthesis protein TonB